MIKDKPATTTDAPECAVLTARLFKGVYAQGNDGKPLRLAVVDDSGHIVEEGDAISRAAWRAALDTYWQHLRDLGVMRSYGSTPPPQPAATGKPHVPPPQPAISGKPRAGAAAGRKKTRRESPESLR